MSKEKRFLYLDKAEMGTYVNKFLNPIATCNRYIIPVMKKLDLPVTVERLMTCSANPRKHLIEMAAELRAERTATIFTLMRQAKDLEKEFDEAVAHVARNSKRIRDYDARIDEYRKIGDQCVNFLRFPERYANTPRYRTGWFGPTGNDIANRMSEGRIKLIDEIRAGIDEVTRKDTKLKKVPAKYLLVDEDGVLKLDENKIRTKFEVWAEGSGQLKLIEKLEALAAQYNEIFGGEKYPVSISMGLFFSRDDKGCLSLSKSIRRGNLQEFGKKFDRKLFK